MSEYAHIKRQIAKIEAEETVAKEALDELIYAALCRNCTNGSAPSGASRA